LWQRHKAERGVWSEKMLKALAEGVKGKVWFSLVDKIYAEQTLQLAWAKVQSNAGACGEDGITVKHFEKDSQQRLLAVKEQIKEGTYQPKPVKRVKIPKLGSSEKRPLGIPTVRDRIVQTAVRMVIEPIFEREFAEHSYGYRPGRGCREALRRVDELLQQGMTHIVEVDIKGYFDHIPHEKLMSLVREKISDGRVLTLIEKFLGQGIREEVGAREEIESTEGTPQGGVISPLLANIYLNPLDHLMSRSGHEMVRYADDMVILCRNAEEARNALGKIREWAEAAGLELHPEKTKIVDMGQPQAHFDFLGYRFWRNQTSGRIQRFIRPKSQKKFRAAIKPLVRRTSGQSLEAIAQQLRPKLQGFFGYFKHAHKNSLRAMDGWLRGRLRAILRKRYGLKGRGRGADHQRWDNHYFTELGFFNLEAARAEEIFRLRYAANY
jgi:RNA-directed DNA polymerase